MWSFSPLEEKEYTFAPKLIFWPTQTPECNDSDLTLKATGVGSKGFIVVGMIVGPHAYGVVKISVDHILSSSRRRNPSWMLERL